MFNISTSNNILCFSTLVTINSNTIATGTTMVNTNIPTDTSVILSLLIYSENKGYLSKFE